jgi:hypothetical protein
MISTVKSKRIRWEKYFARVGEEINACSVLVTKTKGKRTLERSNDRRDDNNKTNSVEMM